MNDWHARAKSAGLTYIQDFEVGLSRRKCGKGFKFIDAQGKPLTCRFTRKRVEELVIPPAWKEVWICPDADGHIQATGLDDAGRKQYIYHEKWHQASSTHKFGRLKQFAKLLPKIRKRVEADLHTEELNKSRVVAAVVRLLDKACIRVGNKQYLESNDSRGATTLSSDNVCCDSGEISLNFRGKSGKQIDLKCSDGELAAVIEDCEKSEGEFLFSYQNHAGEFVPVTSCDVNRYLFEITKNSVTAKDFRTWRASVVALNSLMKMDTSASKTATKRFVAGSVREAAATLGNTPAVCRCSYIHYAILTGAEDGSLPQIMAQLESGLGRRAGLTRAEARLYAFLTHAEEQDSNVIELDVLSRKAA